MAVSGVNGSNGNQNLSPADLKTIEELEKEIKEDKERLKGLKKNREDMVEGSSRDNVDKAIKDLEKTIKNKEERLKALKAGETPTPNGDAGKTDGFDGAGIGEEEGLKNFIKTQGGTSSGLTKNFSKFFEMLRTKFLENTKVNPKTNERVVLTAEDKALIEKYGEDNFWAIKNGEKTEEDVILNEKINDNVNISFNYLNNATSIKDNVEEKKTEIKSQIEKLQKQIEELYSNPDSVRGLNGSKAAATKNEKEAINILNSKIEQLESDLAKLEQGSTFGNKESYFAGSEDSFFTSYEEVDDPNGSDGEKIVQEKGKLFATIDQVSQKLDEILGKYDGITTNASHKDVGINDSEVGKFIEQTKLIDAAITNTKADIADLESQLDGASSYEKTAINIKIEELNKKLAELEELKTVCENNRERVNDPIDKEIAELEAENEKLQSQIDEILSKDAIQNGVLPPLLSRLEANNARLEELKAQRDESKIEARDPNSPLGIDNSDSTVEVGNSSMPNSNGFISIKDVVEEKKTEIKSQIEKLQKQIEELYSNPDSVRGLNGSKAAATKNEKEAINILNSKIEQLESDLAKLEQGATFGNKESYFTGSEDSFFIPENSTSTVDSNGFESIKAVLSATVDQVSQKLDEILGKYEGITTNASHKDIGLSINDIGKFVQQTQIIDNEITNTKADIADLESQLDGASSYEKTAINVKLEELNKKLAELEELKTVCENNRKRVNDPIDKEIAELEAENEKLQSQIDEILSKDAIQNGVLPPLLSRLEANNARLEELKAQRDESKIDARDPNSPLGIDNSDNTKADDSVNTAKITQEESKTELDELYAGYDDAIKENIKLTKQELSSKLHAIESQLGGINSGISNVKEYINNLIERRNSGENIPDSAIANAENSLNSLENQATQLLKDKSNIEEAMHYQELETEYNNSFDVSETSTPAGADDAPVSTPKRDILTDVNTVKNFDNDQKTISNSDDKVRNSEYYSVKDEVSQLDSELEDLEKELDILSDISKFRRAQMSERIKNAGTSIMGNTTDSSYYSKMTSEDRKNRLSELKEKIAEKKAKLQAKKEKLAELRQEKELKNQALSEKLDNEIANADKVENSNSTNGIDAESKQQISDFLEDKVATYEEKVKEEKAKIADLEKTLKTLEEQKEKQTTMIANIINPSSSMATSAKDRLTLINAQIQTSTNELDTIYASYDEDFAMLLNFKSELASLKSGTMTQDDAEKLLDVIKADDNVKESSDKGATATPISSDLTDDIQPFGDDDKSGDGLLPKKYLKDQEFKLI